MEKPYDEILKKLKLHYNFIVNSENSSNLNNDDMTWATQIRDILEIMKNENIKVIGYKKALTSNCGNAIKTISLNV